MSGGNVIETRGLVKRYGSFTAVAGVDIRVEQGRYWGLLGPNGAGKTTLLKMLIGTIPPSAGELTVLGCPVPERATTMRRYIGVVPQKDNLDPDFTVAENLRVFGAYFGLGGRELEARIDHLLAFAALEGKRDAPIGALSGGMQRRLSLVRALVNDPQLLILDEPTTGLDPQARQHIWQKLRELRARGLTLVLTTHYMEEAQRLCDRVTIMDHGRILDADPPRTLIGRHIEPHVVEVFGHQLEDWHRRVGRALARRSERVGETMFYYTDVPGPLLEALEGHEELTYLHRPANLEDVFVKLTGHELREGQ